RPPRRATARWRPPRPGHVLRSVSPRSERGQLGRAGRATSVGTSLALLGAACALACAWTPGARASALVRASPRPFSVTLQWLGDIALSAERGLPPGGVRRALAPVRRPLREGDLTLGNLEGTLSVGGASKCGGLGGGTCFAFQAPPGEAGELRALGFGLLNQANNHSL